MLRNCFIATSFTLVLASGAAGQIRTAQTLPKPIEASPRITDLLGKLTTEDEKLRRSIEDASQTFAQALRRAVNSTAQDRQNAIAVAEKALAKTLVDAHASANQTAEYLDQLDDELREIERAGDRQTESLRAVKTRIDEQIQRMEKNLADY